MRVQVSKVEGNKNMLCALIMAGGKGTRFWPLSTEEKPKQFLKLINEETMIQMTVNRIKDIIPMERIFVCTGERYISLVQEQLPELNQKNIIIEPEGRNTAPCIALSTMIIKRYYGDATIAVLPSDHLIKDENAFREILLDGKKYLVNNRETILTLGMTPNRPEVGYGYIKFTREKTTINNNEIIEVEKFVEKPNLEKAEEYLLDGRYLWNGGMFIWTVENIITQIREFIPKTFEALKNVISIDEKELQNYINENYSKTDSISVDYAILEKSNKISVIPSNIGWDDIGTWKAIERYKEKDSQDNILNENTRAIESKSNMTISNNKKVIMIGVKNIMTVETEEAIFIVNKNYMENLNNYKNIL